MKILVALKQLPARDSSIRTDARGKWCDEQDPGYEINEPDAYAPAAALLLKDQHGGEVVVVCAGRDRAASSNSLTMGRRLTAAVRKLWVDRPGGLSY
jgi:electron transfer flavoprotein beta subunit